MDRPMPPQNMRSLSARMSAVTLVCAALFVSSSTSGFAASPAGTTLDISKFMFGPKEITVTPGTKVVWTNHDEAPHTVASKDKSFTSKGLDTDDKFDHTFDKEGDFDYYCTLHPFMTGVVHVRK
jgi:plastocyanin